MKLVHINLISLFIALFVVSLEWTLYPLLVYAAVMFVVITYIPKVVSIITRKQILHGMLYITTLYLLTGFTNPNTDNWHWIPVIVVLLLQVIIPLLVMIMLYTYLVTDESPNNWQKFMIPVMNCCIHAYFLDMVAEIQRYL